MKKRFLFISAILFFCGIEIFAQEISVENNTQQNISNVQILNEEPVVFRENISLALLFRLHGEKAGGSIEFGFPILKNTKYLYMRGYTTFEITGGHLPEYGFLTLAGGFKFQAGGKIDRRGFRFVVYGFFAPQFGGLAAGGVPSKKPPTYLELAGGAGFEFFFSPSSSFFIEYGGGCYIPFGGFKQNAGTMFTVGHRRFF